MQSKSLITSLVVALTLQVIGVGCNGSDQNSQIGLSAQNEQFGGESLQGTWGTGCRDIRQSDINDAQSSESTLTFNGNNVTADYALYADARCKTLLMRERQEGNYVLDAAPDSSENAPAIDYNITHDSVTYFDQRWIDRVTNDGSSRSSSDNSGCDMSKFTFEVGVPQDLSGQEWCMHQDGIGQERYSVIKVEGNHLFMGATGRGSANGDYKDARSTKLGRDHWVKQ